MRKTFDQWMREVKAEISKSGLHADDLPDVPYKDWYDDRVSVKSAAKRAIRNAMD